MAPVCGLEWIMSNRFDHAQLSLTIKSPTNIGGPETLSAKDYLYNYDVGEVYLLNNYEWFQFLDKHKKLKVFETYMQNEMIRSNGRTMYDWAKQTLGASNLTKAVLGPVVRSTMKASIYQADRKNSLNDIIPQIRSVDGQVYIPGSSIKGVINNAIISHLLRSKSELRSTVQERLHEVLRKYYDFQHDTRRCQREVRSALKNVERSLADSIHVLSNDRGDRFNGILASVFRGISVSDAMPSDKIQTEVLKKEDACVEEQGTHTISVFRECILPNQVFNFTITLDTAITKEIGITDVDQILHILQEDFKATRTLLTSKFKKVSSSVFSALDGANAYIGGNTGFIQKTVIMAAFKDNPSKGIEVIKAILDVNFSKDKHNIKDTHIAPRAIKLVKWNGHHYEMGGIRIGRSN